MLPEITPLILTYNEAPNIGRALEKLRWAGRIVVVDSFSTDETVSICQRCPQVEVIRRRFDDHTTQWNFGLSQVKTEWALALDADYILSDELVTELKQLSPEIEVNAYFASFKYCIHGRRLRASLYPPRAVLFRPGHCRYVPDGHTQKLEIKGATRQLDSFIEHDDRKPLAHWLWAQDRYAALEAKKLLAHRASNLPAQDRLRRWIFPAPPLCFFYTLFLKGLIFEGWPGWYYVFQRTLAEMILSLHLMEAKLKRG